MKLELGGAAHWPIRDCSPRESTMMRRSSCKAFEKRTEECTEEARRLVAWLATKPRPPTSYMLALCSTIPTCSEMRWLCSTSRKPGHLPDTHFYLSCVWLGGLEHVRLMLKVASLDVDNQEDWLQKAKRLVDHCLANAQNVALIVSLTLNLSYIVGTRSFAQSAFSISLQQPPPPTALVEVTYAFNAAAIALGMTTLLYTLMIRRFVGSQLQTPQARVLWLLASKAEARLTSFLHLTLFFLTKSIVLGAWVILRNYGIETTAMMVILLWFWFLAIHIPGSILRDELLYDEVQQVAHHHPPSKVAQPDATEVSITIGTSLSASAARGPAAAATGAISAAPSFIDSDDNS